MQTGGARLSWVSDYSQIYLIDRETAAFRAPEDVTETSLVSGFAAAEGGLVIYTADSLSQEVRIEIHDAPPGPTPVDAFTGLTWTKTAEAALTCRSGAFIITSPSGFWTDTAGPVFFVPAGPLKVRLFWREDEALRYETERKTPDVILVQLWPEI